MKGEPDSVNDEWHFSTNTVLCANTCHRAVNGTARPFSRPGPEPQLC